MMSSCYSRCVFCYFMIRRPLWTLPISAALIAKLRNAGYEYVEDVLCDANKEDIKKLIPDVSNIDFESLISVPSSSTAAELFKTEMNRNGGIITFSRAIDDLFNTGIPTGKITEFVGAPGTGKSQLCFQLCVSVQMPEFIGGISGSAVYISTNNNFSKNRIKEIHGFCASHCAKIAGDVSKLSNIERTAVLNFIQNDPLLRISRFNVRTAEQLRACVFHVQKSLEKSKSNIRLLIIDSLTFPFHSTGTNIERTRRISSLLNHLNKVAASHQVAVVLINELTTYVSDNGLKEVIPSLGETFAHAVHNRLVLGEKNHSGYYTALLTKSSEFPVKTAFFQITDGGIRDVPAS